MQLDTRGQAVYHLLRPLLADEQLEQALAAWLKRYTFLSKLALGQFIEIFHAQLLQPITPDALYRQLLAALLQAENGPAKDPLVVFAEPAPELPPLNAELASDSAFESGDQARQQAVQAAEAGARAMSQLPGVMRVADFLDGARATEAAAPSPLTATSTLVASPTVAPSAAPAPDKIDPKSTAFAALMTALLDAMGAAQRDQLLDWCQQTLPEVTKPQVVAQLIAVWKAPSTTVYDASALSTATLRDIVSTVYAGMCLFLGPVKADNLLVRASNTAASACSGRGFDVNDLL